MSDSLALHAWGDESMRSVGLPDPAYLLGAVVADPDGCDDYRDQLRALRTTGPKLHWRQLDDSHKQRAVDAIASFDVYHVVVVGTPLDERKQERARALCVRRLGWHLGEQGVTHLALEARTQSLMKHDLSTINAMRGAAAIRPELRIDHEQPSVEPMLWVADQVLGAVGDNLAGDSRWYRQLDVAIEIIWIDV